MMWRADEQDIINIGLFIPVSGPAGIWGPSCRSCAEMAAAEINAQGGLSGKEVVLHIVDAGRVGDEVAASAKSMMLAKEIDVLIGMHTSDVRVAIAEKIAGSIPYIYTPLYEGGDVGSGVFCIGETPGRQILPPIDWLVDRYNSKRWILIGNDYIWPHKTHQIVRRHFGLRKQIILDEIYLPFGTKDFSNIIEKIKALSPDALLLSLVGEDAVHFNRSFGKAGLSSSILRFSCAIEENLLLAIGESNLDQLFVASSYFSALETDKNDSFRKRYYSRYGERGPVLNAIGQGLYEGIFFLKELASACFDKNWLDLDYPIKNCAVRDNIYTPQSGSSAPIYLAEATGYNFNILKTFKEVI